VTDEGAGGGAGGLHGGDAGVNVNGDAAGGVGEAARTDGLEQLEDQRGHGVDLRVARADEGHRPAPACQLERVADPRFFVAEREAVLLLAGVEIGHEIEIEAVADPVGGDVQGGNRRDGAAELVTRTDADDVQHAGGMAEAQRIDRFPGTADGAGRALRLALGDGERAGPEGRSLGDAWCAGFGLDDLGGIDEPVAFLVELGDGEDSERNAEMFRCGMERPSRWRPRLPSGCRPMSRPASRRLHARPACRR